MKPETIREMEEQFAIRRKLASARDRQLFGVMDNDDISDEETVALKFLYAYMPLSDMANYDGAMFLSHVRAAIRIRGTVPWSKQISDELFYYFILPYRVNNENIEDIRELLFNEIYPRVKELSMTEAVLETNQWCHEKANYIGNDIRTVSPLTLIRTALGRCGEQSSLAVAALRSIGIPARQVYTPRWAHCDSNHAWVEAWADGDWHFFGACEPDPLLGMGWFRKPARRSMLVHTRVPSRYSGDEKVTFAKPWLSELNLLDRYAPSKRITVTVRDGEGRAAAAKVDFQLYNAGELSTIVSLDTDASGEVSLELGLGNVWVHASGAEGMAFVKLDVASKDRARLTLAPQTPEGTIDADMVPPAELPDLGVFPDAELAEENSCRVREGAAIRAAYEATFLGEEDAAKLAASLGLHVDRVWAVLRHARGNSREIAAFLSEQCPQHDELPLLLLESLRDKDMTDTFRETLEDHLLGSLSLRSELTNEIFAAYVMCPRLHFEMLEPYRAFFQSELAADLQTSFRADPSRLADWIGEWFRVDESYSHYKGMASPAGSYRLKVGDKLSRDILFAAMARSLGIPARLEPSDQRPQYMLSGQWVDASFTDVSSSAEQLFAGADDDKPGQRREQACGRIRLLRAAGGAEFPRYYEDFTLARLVDHSYVTLSHGNGNGDSVGAQGLFDAPLEVPPGHYRLTTGTRLPDGTVLMRLAFFAVRDGETVDVPVELRQAATEIPVLAVADRTIKLASLDGDAATTLAEVVSSGGNAVLAWIEPDREPSKHLLRELRELRDELGETGAPIYLIIGEEKRSAGFVLPDSETLPNTATLVKDDAVYSELAALAGCMPSVDNKPGSFPVVDASRPFSFPVVAVVDGALRVRYFTTGYKLGIAREVAATLNGVTNNG